MSTPDKIPVRDFAISLIDLVNQTRLVLTNAERLHEANLLGEAGAAPDDIARAIACLTAAKNSAVVEALPSLEAAA